MEKYFQEACVGYIRFAHMPAGQGRVGLFLLFRFYLEVFERIYILEGSGLIGPLIGAPHFCAQARYSCMVPSPFCGRLAIFINFINKTRIKSDSFIKCVQTGTNVA